MSSIKKVDVNGATYPVGNVFYGTCSTGASTAAKVVSCANGFDSNDLTAGSILILKNTTANTAAVANLTLNVNSTGAKNVKKQYNTTANSNLNATGEFIAGTMMFVYDGTYWQLVSSNYEVHTSDSYTGDITGVTAGTGLSGGGASGSVTLNHSNSVTAQTTQAVYPITYDAQGHITGSGSAVTIPTQGFTEIYAEDGDSLTASQSTQFNVIGDSSSGITTYWNGINLVIDGSNIETDLPAGVQKVFYGTCSTAAGTAAKVVTCANFASSDLTAGTVIFVDFTSAQTASSCTLNINSTGAKTAYKYGTTAVNSGSWSANEVVGFVYDGTYWNLIYQVNTDTDTKVTQAAATTNNGAYPIILAYSTATTSVTNTVNKSSNLTYNPSTKALVTGGTVDGINVATHTHSLSNTTSYVSGSYTPQGAITGATSSSGTYTILTLGFSGTPSTPSLSYTYVSSVGAPQ